MSAVPLLELSEDKHHAYSVSVCAVWGQAPCIQCIFWRCLGTNTMSAVHLLMLSGNKHHMCSTSVVAVWDTRHVCSAPVGSDATLASYCLLSNTLIIKYKCIYYLTMY